MRCVSPRLSLGLQAEGEGGGSRVASVIPAKAGIHLSSWNKLLYGYPPSRARRCGRHFDRFGDAPLRAASRARDDANGRIRSYKFREITTGVWSDGLSQLRGLRSICALESRASACGDSKIWSMRKP